MDSHLSSQTDPPVPAGADEPLPAPESLPVPDPFSESHVLSRDKVAPSAEANAPAASPEQTVISKTPPIDPQEAPLAQGMHPRQMGQALEGEQIDDVFLEQYIGGGGMGAVFRALDTKLHRTVAVKVLSTYQTGEADTERRFEVEARSAARLDHPNIARVYYAGEGRGVRYIAFEYIEGTNVRDLVRSYGPFPLNDALRYTLQIADALVHAWQREVVHRDIKPSNILITPEAQAKLVDMGLARYEQIDAADQEQTATGVTLGTFDYISPEQARNPRDADTRSDIYSLGCTLFFMLTGQPPFPNGSPMQKVLRHQTDPPPNLREQRPDVPEAVVQMVETMLAKRPEDRFQNPNELVAVLASCSEQLGIGSAQLAMPSGWASWSLRQSQWRRHALWVVPSLLLLVGVLGIELATRHEATPPEFSELQIPTLAAPNAPEGETAPPITVTPSPQTADAASRAQGAVPEPEQGVAVPAPTSDP